jgi:predicted nucleotidyltransferase
MKIFKWKGIEYQLILLNLAGSRFYNTHYEKGEHPFDKEYISDNDYRGIFIASNKNKTSLSKNYVTEIQPAKDDLIGRENLISQINQLLNLNIKLDEDISLYEVEKFLNSSIDNNPNIMDVLWSDKESIYYKSEEFDLIFKNKKLFTSKKILDSFSGYALSQLHRIKSHYKMLTLNPKINDIYTLLKKIYLSDNKEIDFGWIRDNFNGELAKSITGITQQEYNQHEKFISITWDTFVKKYCKDIPEIEDYRRPQLINFIKAKDIKAHNYNLSTTKLNTEGLSLKKYLLFKATFRTIGESVYNIFTLPNNRIKGGIFGTDGNIKKNDPEQIGDFLCSIIVKKNEYKKSQDYVKKLWEWKCNRNEKRSELEKRFGYDVKHAGHLVRLLEAPKNIFKTGEYKPRLEGEFLLFIKDIMNGKYSYDFIVKYAEEENKKNQLLKQQQNKFVPEKVDKNKIELLLQQILNINKF